MHVPALLQLPALQRRKPCVTGNQGTLVTLALVSWLAGIMLHAACRVRFLFCLYWICWACGRVQGHNRLHFVGSYRLRRGPYVAGQWDQAVTAKQSPNVYTCV